MIKSIVEKCCEHCGSPEEKQCYTIASFPDTIVPSMTLCEDCLKLLSGEITTVLGEAAQ